MATLNITHTFVDTTPAEAAEVNENFDDVADFVNAEVIQRDASVAFTSVPSGPATDASTANQYVRKAQFDVEVAARAAGDAASLDARRGVRLFTASSHAISTSVVNPLTFATEIGDTDFWVSGTDATIPVGAGGIYAVTVKVTHVSGSNFGFVFRVRHTNDSEVWNLQDSLSATEGDITQGFVATFVAGDTIRLDCMNVAQTPGIAIRGSLELWRVSA